ncbi:centromere protein T-like [Orbicella faveolata]|nr:centromere protein T-like [Orbicella faveolata]
MPSALVKSIFQHFSKAKLSKEALQVVENGSNLFFKQVSGDLMAYCRHAHRTTIELADVELLMKRQGFITDNQSLYSLVEKYLPLEYRQEIIPTVQAGNKIVLK